MCPALSVLDISLLLQRGMTPWRKDRHMKKMSERMKRNRLSVGWNTRKRREKCRTKSAKNR